MVGSLVGYVDKHYQSLLHSVRDCFLLIALMLVPNGSVPDNF